MPDEPKVSASRQFRLNRLEIFWNWIEPEISGTFSKEIFLTEVFFYPPKVVWSKSSTRHSNQAAARGPQFGVYSTKIITEIVTTVKQRLANNRANTEKN